MVDPLTLATAFSALAILLAVASSGLTYRSNQIARNSNAAESSRHATGVLASFLQACGRHEASLVREFHEPGRAEWMLEESFRDIAVQADVYGLYAGRDDLTQMLEVAVEGLRAAGTVLMFNPDRQALQTAQLDDYMVIPNSTVANDILAKLKDEPFPSPYAKALRISACAIAELRAAHVSRFGLVNS